MRRIAAVLWMILSMPAWAQAPVELTHIHGLAFSPDGKRLMIPSHHGLAVFKDGKWSKAPGPQHDYMGFAATARHLYSSGHPAPDARLVNPFGLIRSRDGGRTWEKLGLEGETDFHVLATGWNSGAIYVWNPAPSSRMKRTGLHFTLDDGRTWKRSAAAGVSGDLQQIAVHPDEAGTVALATTEGVFVSRDSGNSFTPLAKGIDAFSVSFDLDGKHAWVGSFDGKARLARVALADGKASEVPLPPLGRDAVLYIAQNPAIRGKYAIATAARSVFISKDDGKTWTQVASRGKTGSP